jgi:hypothetical protein
MDLRTYRHKAASRFVEACREGRLKAARAVLEDARIAPDGAARAALVASCCPITKQTGLQAAAFMGRDHVVRWLCSEGRAGALVPFNVDQPCADPKYRGTAIHYAARGGRHEVIQLLLQAGAGKHSKDAKGREPVDWAIEQKRSNICFLFRDRCSEPLDVTFDKKRTTPNELVVSWARPVDLGGLPLLGYRLYVRRMRPYEPPLDNTLEGRAKEEARLETIRSSEDYSHPNPYDHGYRGKCEQRMVQVGPGHLEAKCDDLLPANIYLVCVTGLSQLGDGAPSTWVEMTTKPTVPSPPPCPFVVATTCRTITVGWDLPGQVNGRRVTMYELTKRRATGGPFKIFAKVSASALSAREALLADLEAGDGFRFKVRAKNSVGFSNWSRESRVIRTNTGAAMILRSDRTIRLSWVAPFIGRARYRGQYEIQQKRVLSRKEAAHLAHLEATKQISGVTDDERGKWVPANVGSRARLQRDAPPPLTKLEKATLPKYLHSVRRGDALEDLEGEEEEGGEEEGGVEGKRGMDADSGDGSDDEKEKDPEPFKDGLEDSDEEDEALFGGLLSTMADPEAEIVSLLPNTRYTFRLRADVEVPTPWELAIESNDLTTEVGVPEPPIALVALTVTHDSAWVSWGRPHDNGLPVEAFRITVSAEERKSEAKEEAPLVVHVPIVDFRSNMPPTASGVEGTLTPGTRYFFRCQAYNECGWGPACPKTLIQTRSIESPEPPWTVEDVMGADTFVLLRWTPFSSRSASGVVKIDQYRIQLSDDYDPIEHEGPHMYPGTWRDANTMKGVVPGNDTEMIVRDGLKSVHRYFFRIAARNAADGCWSMFSKPSKPWTSQRRW